MADLNLESFSDPFDAIMDYDEPLSSSRQLSLPVVDYFLPSHKEAFLRPMIRPDRSVTSSWPTNDIDAKSAYSKITLNTRAQSTAHPASTAHADQSLYGQDSLMLPQGSCEGNNFGTLHMGPDSFFLPFSTMNASKTASPSGISVTGFSSSGSSSVRSPPSYKESQPGTNSGFPGNPPKKIETTCMNSHQSCLSSALDILQALHIPPTACLCSIDETSTSADKRQPRKTDVVLATNRIAVRRLSDILQCSCISSSQVQLLFIIVCDKLLAWYRALLRNFPDNRQDDCSNTTANAITHNFSPDSAADTVSERVIHQRFAVGEYSFDFSQESKICAQAVASELQPLDIVIANFADRFQKKDLCRVDPALANKSSRSTSTIDSIELPNAVHARLTAHLQKQLQVTKAAMAVYG